jgi:PAS domain S-box-containing protein
MKTSCRCARLACGLLALLACALGARAQAPDTSAPAGPRLKVMMEHRSAPFAFLDAEGRPAGFVVELMRAVAAEQNLELEFDLRPWQLIYDEFRQGRGDVLGLVAYSDERAKLMDFSIAYERMYCALYIAEKSAPLRTLADLHGKRLAVIRDAITHEFLKRHPELNATPVTFDSLQQCLESVRRGESDATLGMGFVTDYIIRNEGISGVKRTELELRDVNYSLSFAVHRGEAALLRRINEGLMRTRVNGSYDRLYEKWLGPLQPRDLRWNDFRPYALPTLLILGVTLAALVWQRRMLRQVSGHAAALRQSEERLSLVLEGSQDGFWDWDARSGTVLRSPRWFSMLGYSPEEVRPGREGFLELVHPDDLPRVIADEKEIWRRRESFALEFRLRAKNGEWKWILDRGKVVARDPVTDEPLRITGTHTDITPRKLAEREAENLQRKMQETQRLESLGVLAGGIAHDFNNLLTVILGNTSLLRLDARTTPEMTARLEKITTASNRAADLCRQLLAYAGKGAFTIERLHVNEIVRDTTHLLELSLNRNASLGFAFGENLPDVEADPAQLQQIIMNLVMNASDAIGDTPGQIRISTAAVPLRANELADALPSPEIPAGLYVKLEVSDTGCGMSPEVIAHIFDPFYTTKFTGRGLGLAAVLGIVRSHRGALTVRSTPGRGSVFRIYLPAAPGTHRDAAVPDKPAPPLARGSGVVLVADDDTAVRQLLGELLARLGYEPVLTADGQEAVAQFTREPARFRAALIDLTMPGLDGLATLRELRRLRPELPCILLSGYTEQEARVRDDTHEFTAFIQKPFTPESLNDTLLRATKGA